MNAIDSARLEVAAINFLSGVRKLDTGCIFEFLLRAVSSADKHHAKTLIIKKDIGELRIEHDGDKMTLLDAMNIVHGYSADRHDGVPKQLLAATFAESVYVAAPAEDGDSIRFTVDRPSRSDAKTVARKMQEAVDSCDNSGDVPTTCFTYKLREGIGGAVEDAMVELEAALKRIIWMCQNLTSITLSSGSKLSVFDYDKIRVLFNGTCLQYEFQITTPKVYSLVYTGEGIDTCDSIEFGVYAYVNSEGDFCYEKNDISAPLSIISVLSLSGDLTDEEKNNAKKQISIRKLERLEQFRKYLKGLTK